MRSTRPFRLAFFLALSIVLVAREAAADTFSVVRSFNGGTGDPAFGLAGVGVGTNIYTYGSSSVVTRSLVTPGPAQVLHTFTGGTTDGSSPTGRVVTDGTKLYGVTASGGPSPTPGLGTAWSMDLNGANYQLIFKFPFTGSSPVLGEKPLFMELMGTRLVGVAREGGIHLTGETGYGFVFGMNTDGASPGTHHAFTSSEGRQSSGPVSNGTDLFATTDFSPIDGINGTVYKIGPNGAFLTLHTFPVGRSSPRVLSAIGNTVYGSTSSGYFSVTSDGSNYLEFSTPPPTGLQFGSKLYGVTATGGDFNLGTLYSTDLAGSKKQILHSFAGGTTDGSTPLAGLMLIGNTIYGTTSAGGGSSSGTVFALVVPEPSSYALAALALAALIAFKSAARKRRHA